MTAIFTPAQALIAAMAGASFKNAEQVHKCASAGCHSVTVAADILKTVISHPMTKKI